MTSVIARPRPPEAAPGRHDLSTDLGKVPEPERRGLVVPAALLVVSVLLLGFGAFQLWGSNLHHERAQSQLTSELRDRIDLAVALAAAPTVDGETSRLPPAPAGGAVAFLEIPSIGLREVVVEGSGSAELAKGPGHVKGTPLPGRVGNAVVFGHRTVNGAPFRDLDRIDEGAKITTITPEGRFDYEVERVEVRKPGGRDVFAQGQLNQLTLATAHPEHRASGRLAVIARLVGTPVATTSDPERMQLADELGLTGTTAAWPRVFGWGLAVVAVVIAALRLYRRWPPLVAYLVTVPTVAAVVLLFFESLTLLLPSTL